MNKKSKVAIDARMIEASGIGTYIQHIIDSDIYDVAVGNPDTIHKYNKNIDVVNFESSIYGLKGQLLFPFLELKTRGVDVIHFPHYNVPLLYSGKFVVTVHDLTQIIFPELLGNKFKVAYAKCLMSHALKKSRHVFTVSNNSKKDINRIFGIDNQKISITYNAVDEDFRKKRLEEYEYAYEMYGITKGKKVLLYVGNLKPHKNLGRLLEAVAMLENREEYVLVLAGRSFVGDELIAKEKKLGIDELVIHTGEVTKEELVDLYNLADLFVFPSLYEGFGIPPLEAMACGTPVVASNTSSIPEVVGDAAVMFDPRKSDDLVNAIYSVFQSDFCYNGIISKGFFNASDFSWKKTINEIKKVL